MIHAPSRFAADPAGFFRALPAIDWTGDLEQVARSTECVLRELAADKALFRALLLRVPDQPTLWSKCEEDLVEDKIVLWDDIDKGIRIRLRMSTCSQERLAHCHRFSFTNLVLRGRYVHWIYQPLETFDERTRLDDVREVVMHDDHAGDCFTIHHDTLHSTPFLEPHTVSLVLRGNPLKERAPVMFKESRRRAEVLAEGVDGAGMDSALVEPAHADAGTLFWRVGEDQESKERRRERQMSRGIFDRWVRTLTDYEII